MPSSAASLGQLAVVSDVISREEHRELTRQLQESLRRGQPLSYARLLVQRGIPSAAVEKLLEQGASLEAVRCDACGASIPQANLRRRREYPCLRCGAPLLGFRAYAESNAQAAAARTRSRPGSSSQQPAAVPSRPASHARAPGSRIPGSGLEHELPTITHGQVLPLPGQGERRRDLELPTPTVRPAQPEAPTDILAQGTLMFRDVLRAPALEDLDEQLSEELSTMDFGDVFKLPNTPAVGLSDEDLVTAYGALTSEQGQVVIEDSVAPEEYAEIGGFKVLAALGEGGMGRVYLARESRSGRDVALKVLRGTLATDGEFLQRFQQESVAVTGQRHKNVVEIVAAGHDAHYDMHYIAFEYVSGGTLEDKIRDGGPLPEAEALGITLGIARGLAFTSGLGFVHRDVKPSNIILTDSGEPKIADLGLARQLDASTRVTAAGVVLGTPAYIAPEQATDVEDLDVRADIYALGVCLYEMLSGKLPLEDDAETVEILLRHVEEDVPDIRLDAPEVNASTAQLIKGLTARKRKNRYPTPAAVILDVERVLAGKEPLGPKQAGARSQQRDTQTPSRATPAPAARSAASTAAPPMAPRAPLGVDPKAQTVDLDDTLPPAPSAKGGGGKLVLIVVLAVGLLLALVAAGLGLAVHQGWLRLP